MIQFITKFFTGILIIILVSQNVCVYAQELELHSPSAILMEVSTGEIIYEFQSDEPLAPASVTKVMTLLLIFESLEKGVIKLDDQVVVSEYAASMGGSQVFLESNEVQTVDTMIKCIAIASANDACVAMAEYISGSHEAFVTCMNEKAKMLGMEHTNFVNCNGLDVKGHVTTARDIAIMSRELVVKYPEIYRYTTIWMDTITHVTSKGRSEFGLNSTNKLLKQYPYATGLKTGSTSIAKFCLSATASKEGVDLIAVVMAAPDSKSRIEDCIALLDYGFSITQLYKEKEDLLFDDIMIENGVKNTAIGKVVSPFIYLDTKGRNLDDLTREVIYNRMIEAPVYEGDVVGRVVYKIEDAEIGYAEIVTTETIERMDFKRAFEKLLEYYLL